ncbi:hypothetical protein C7446_2520 [Kushneria sinocarnis]|uniref:Uncharacterized protein n=1 Tax=Kushneria sinocarnis TaxID=595502 RepID=A0A420WUH9_9GAMM|nr:hypothetical protein C7446_2520 [Kushneria sinocarnis]
MQMSKWYAAMVALEWRYLKRSMSEASELHRARQRVAELERELKEIKMGNTRNKSDDT